jgi:hypothetical protein
MPIETDALNELVSKLDEIQPLAAKVAELKDITLEQEAASLIRILEKIKPLLGVASHHIQVGYHTSGEQSSKEHDQWHSQKGLILIDRFEQENTDRDTRGDYVGWQLVLLSDGNLKVLKRSGDWSRWQGESSCWQVQKEEDLSPEEAVRRYGLKEIVEGLVSEIKESSEKLQKAQAGYEKRLATIEKVKEVMG